MELTGYVQAIRRRRPICPRSVSVLEIASVEGTADVPTIVEAFRPSGYERADSHTDHVASLR